MNEEQAGNEFSGVLRRRDDTLYLQSGGITVKLMPVTGATFDQPDGARMRIAGRQEGSAIIDARPLPVTESEALASSFEAVFAGIEAHRAELKAVAGVVNVRPGYRRAAGHLTNEPAIVISVAQKRPRAELAAGDVLPAELDGVPIDVVDAYPNETPEADWVARWRTVLSPMPQPEVAAAAEAARVIGYRPPPDARLEPCKVRDLTCHVGPDAGARLLRPFLAGTQSTLTVSMYELTQQWIIDALLALARNGDTQFKLVLQENGPEAATVAKLRQAWGDRFSYAKAVVSGGHRIFANSFHTKVAVRDHQALWLSSGNWSPHSQPDVPPGANPTMYRLGNREWHVIIKDATLAQMFEKFVDWDRRQAAEAGEAEAAPALVERPDLLVPEAWFREMEAAAVQPVFEPQHFTRDPGRLIDVQPLMTPDNYGRAVLDLIGKAEESLYMQYAYIRAPHDADLFTDLVKAVAARMRRGVDVRVIVDSRNEQDGDVDLLLRLGWDQSRWKRQTSAVHNKGILVDGAIAMVGSQNWSADGTQYNRDASLIFHDKEVASYFNTVFEFDWNNLTKPIGAGEVTPVVAEAGATTPPGMVRIPWSAWYAG
jgi:phosphatidylserine/phosphatidylglycerophosphate/cardiolipin synthase-like enzyme